MKYAIKTKYVVIRRVDLFRVVAVIKHERYTYGSTAVGLHVITVTDMGSETE